MRVRSSSSALASRASPAVCSIVTRDFPSPRSSYQPAAFGACGAQQSAIVPDSVWHQVTRRLPPGYRDAGVPLPLQSCTLPESRHGAGAMTAADADLTVEVERL